MYRFLIFENMKSRLLLLAVGTLFLFSCQKSIEWPDVTGGGTSNQQLLGVWKFKSLSQDNKATITYTDAGVAYKDITISKYTTINNGGTLEITDKLISNKDMTYEVDAIGNYLWYENNVLVDSISLPINFILPTYSASSPYTLGPNNTIISPANPATGEPERTLTYEIVGSKLYMRYTLNETTTRVEMGIILTSLNFSKIELAYEK
jgi:hypothetical protein